MSNSNTSLNQVVTMRDMLAAGVHFGHRSSDWNPRMSDYIYGVHPSVKKVHIINLEKTLPLFHDAMQFVSSVVANRGRVLFVGTKRAAQEIIKVEAERCGMPYVNHRWLGGMLTNYKTIRQSIRRLKDLEANSENGRFSGLNKKESLNRTRELVKLERSLGGIKNMGGLPDAIFVIDVDHENIAIKEANRLGIPVIGVVDSNGCPDGVDYLIPGNDDSTKAITLYASNLANVILDSRGTLPEEVGEERIVMKPKKKVVKKATITKEETPATTA